MPYLDFRHPSVVDTINADNIKVVEKINDKVCMELKTL